MTVAQSSNRYLDRPAPSSLADVIDTILDKGLVIDIYVRVSLVGIELLTIDARIVIASVDTYLRFAEATNRLDLYEKSKDLPEMVESIAESGAEGKSRGLLSGAKEAILGKPEDREQNEEEPEEEEPEEAPRPRRRPAKKAAARRRRAEE
jgi:gas vesicle structural protein